jgi:hypothetical protein
VRPDGPERLDHAKASLRKAPEYLASAEDNLVAERFTAAEELGTSLGGRADAAAEEKALRELLGAKAGVEYGTALVSATKAEPLVRRAQRLVELAIQIVRLGG